jgi:hypothetical protein
MISPWLLLINAGDNVVVCCRLVKQGEVVMIDDEAITIKADVAAGHKIARRPIRNGDRIFKYGMAIGSAIADIECGEWVHIHNMKSDYIGVHLRGGLNGEQR